MKPRFFRKALLALLLLAVLSPLAAQSEQAYAFYRAGEYEKAVMECRYLLTILEIDEDFFPIMDIYAIYMWSLVKQGNYRESLAVAEEALEYSPYDSRFIENKAETLFYLGSYDAAQPLFTDYIVRNPEGARIGDVYYFLGEIYMDKGAYRLADIALTTAVFHEPEEAYWWYRCGFAREMSDLKAIAREAYEKALKWNPGLTEAQERLGRL